ncbi:MAG: hypothetical protein AAF488_01010 [Planctomycetota bacterium]
MLPIHAVEPQRLRTIIALLTLLATFAVPIIANAEEIEWPRGVPDQTLVAIEIPDGARWVETAERLQLVERLKTLPTTMEFLASAQGQQLNRLLTFLETRFDAPVAEVLRSLFSGSWTVAAVLVEPPAKNEDLTTEPRPIIVAQPSRPERVRTALAMLGLFANAGRNADDATGDPLPRILTPLGTLSYTWVENTLLVGQNDTLGRHLVAHYEVASPTSARPRNASPIARVVTDLGQLRTLVGFDPMTLAAANPEPLGDLLFGGMARWIARADRCEVAIDSVAQSLTLRGRARVAKSENRRPLLEQLGAFFPSSPTKLFPMPADGIARLDLSRNLAEWFDHRRLWIAPSAQGGIDEFLVDFGNLTGGLAFDEDILANLPGPLQIFALRSPQLEPVPTPRFPGFAVVSALGDVDPADFERRMRLALQSTVTFINFEQGTGQAPYLVESERYRNARISRAVPVPAPSADRASLQSIEFNFAPAVAIVDGHAVIASHDDAIRQWIDVVRDSASTEHSSLDAHTRFQVNAEGLARLLEANRESLVADEVLDGSSVERARSEIDALISLVGWFKDWSTVGTIEGGTLQIDGCLRVKPHATTKPSVGKEAGRAR